MKRIQRKRTKGWTSPPNTKYVGRPTIWGNPWIVGEPGTEQECVDEYRVLMNKRLQGCDKELWRDCLNDLRQYDNLSCFCALEDKNGNHVPCHIDVLLELLNERDK